MEFGDRVQALSLIFRVRRNKLSLNKKQTRNRRVSSYYRNLLWEEPEVSPLFWCY